MPTTGRLPEDGHDSGAMSDPDLRNRQVPIRHWLMLTGSLVAGGASVMLVASDRALRDPGLHRKEVAFAVAGVVLAVAAAVLPILVLRPFAQHERRPNTAIGWAALVMLVVGLLTAMYAWSVDRVVLT